MTKARDIASAAPAPSTVSATEIGYLDGVSSAIQTQLDAKVAKSLVDAKGDLLVGSANDTVSRLAVASTAGYVLTVDSAEATGLKWATPSAPSAVGCYVYNSAEQGIGGNTWTSMNFDSEYFDTDNIHSTSSNSSRLTVPTGMGGKWAINARVGMYIGTSMTHEFRVLKNGTDEMQKASEQTWGGGSFEYTVQFAFFANLAAGDYIEFQCYSSFQGRNYNMRWMYGFGMMRFGA